MVQIPLELSFVEVENMRRQIFGTAVTIALCLTAPFVYGQQRGKGGERGGKGAEPQHKGGESPNRGGEKSGHEGKGGGKPPGGEWSEGPGKKPSTTPQSNHEGEGGNKGTEPVNRPGTAAGTNAVPRNKPGTSGAEGAAAAANRNKPAASGAEGAAAGAAAANRKNPSATGAEGAAAGAAAANRNNPAATGAQGAAVGAAAANRNNPALSGAQGAALGAAASNGNPSAAGYGAVRNSFEHPNVYNQQWHDDHPDAWRATNWPADNAWAAASMADIASHCGYPATPVSYGYGNNVTNQGGNVLVDGQNVGTSEEFSQQAADLAVAGQKSEASADDEWLPIGVFALVRSEEQHAQLTVQLAINKQGILRGNYTDLVSDHTLPIQGSTDKQTQRSAWTVGNNKNFYIEAGLSNLASGEAPALIHKFNRTEKWLLISLPKPDSDATAAAEDNAK